MKDLNTIVSDPLIKTVFDPVTAEEMLRINPLENVSEPPAVLNIVDNSGQQIPSFTLGNLSLMIGKAKSKKTFFSALLIASYLGYKNEKVLGNPTAFPNVIWFDTEQSPYHLISMVKRVCSLINDPNPKNLYVYQLRTLTTDERIYFIDYVISKIPASLVLIDGIKDLVSDINSPDQATSIVTRLMKWSTEDYVHIINVLHMNKADGNARGHLGTELTNKAETVLSIEVTDDPFISIVKAEYTRDKEFKPFSFTINSDSLPELCDTPDKESGKPRNQPNLVSKDIHNKILYGAFQDKRERRYDELWRSIKLSAANNGLYFGDSRAKDYLAYYIKEGLIIKDEEKKLYGYTKAIF
jgi:hypothetical protein